MQQYTEYNKPPGEIEKEKKKRKAFFKTTMPEEVITIAAQALLGVRHFCSNISSSQLAVLSRAKIGKNENQTKIGIRRSTNPLHPVQAVETGG